MSILFFEFLFYFFFYSFIGWLAEVVYAAFKKKKFVNRGLLSSSFCPSYGISMFLSLVFFVSLKNQPVFLFLACFIVTCVAEFLSGTLLEKFFHRKCWDYSNAKWSLGSYVSLPFSLMWAMASCIFIMFLQPSLERFWHWIPGYIGEIIIGVITILFLIDVIVTFAAFRKIKLQNEMLLEIAQGIQKVSTALDSRIAKYVETRMEKLYPSHEMQEEERERRRREKEARKEVFAYGCGFHKLIWLFFLGAFLGDVVETIYCLITSGVFMSRSSVVYGPFSIVWGLGIAFFTLLLYRYQERSDRFLFFMGMLLGGAYEYACSVFTELVFGTVFWDYSWLPFNLGGRINLLYCFFWGIVAVVWMKGVYPRISRWIEKIPMKIGKTLSWFFLIFMIFNVGISGLALSRYSARQKGIMPQNEVEEYIDEHFTDERMEKIYPNAIVR